MLSWPKNSFGFFHKMLWENPNEFFGLPNTWALGFMEWHRLLYFLLAFILLFGFSFCLVIALK